MSSIVVDDPIEVRQGKREALLAAGEEAYAFAYEASATAAELEARYEELPEGESTADEVSVAGRIMAVRDQGKVVFMVLRDGSGEIQLFCRINTLGEEPFAGLKERLDVGDFIGARGLVMRSRRGQLSVAVESYTLLTKALRPLPEKFHGLADKETRYRQRYVDLIMNPEVKQVFEKRFAVIDTLRRESIARGFVEVETPMLHPIPGGATAKPFVTHHNALDRDFYLRVAPELNLKRLLVGGFERVFEINRSFRNEGMDHSHNPEFTMLEAYQAYTNVEGIARYTRELIQAACLAACGSYEIPHRGVTLNMGGEWPVRPMLDLVSEAVGEQLSWAQFAGAEADASGAGGAEALGGQGGVPLDGQRGAAQSAANPEALKVLVSLAKRHGIATQPQWGAGKLVGELFDRLVEHTLMQPVFVSEHPLEISPLAKAKPGNPLVCDRYELFIAGHEYANLFSELNDPVDQQRRFEAQVAAKAAGDEEAMGFDADYIRALEYGMPPAGGVGIGIDRLVMLLTGVDSIRDVLLFPHMRTESLQ